MGDTYRPSRPSRDRPPPLADRMTFSNGAGDSYRPAQSDFTFQSSHAAPHFPPAGPAADGGRATRSSRGRRGGRNDRGGRSNANGGRRGGAHHKAAPHERELLRHRDGGSPDISFGVEGPSRFMNLDDMSDHEEADMDESDVSAGGLDGAEEHGNAKVARTLAPRADGDSVPKWSTKWSNPDPYTSLPPPSETTGVKKDVVQLIRKAKNQDAEKSIGNNAVAANDDFISFGDDGDDEDGEIDDDDGLMIYEDERLVQGRNRGNDNGNSRHPVEGRMNDLEYIASIPLHAPQHDTYQQQRGGGGRKRGYDDSYIDVVEEWKRPTRGASPSPWVASAGTYGHLLDQPQRWLHNEILDFYDWVAPQGFEHNARDQLVKRISNALGSQSLSPQDKGLILCFGSYPAGLYLPTADMDLVYTSQRHYNGGPPVFDPQYDKPALKKTLYKASNRLQKVGIADKVNVIIHAKVPIIKFNDRVTKLAVDISFENLSGVQAQATFQKWKEQYPDMIYMVALVKQLLVMRGLNEVHTGGLGGFTIICLIVSYLEHSEKADNLGDCFIGFLRYYGKTFDLAKQRIQMSPPAIVRKSTIGIDGRPEQPAGLSIQDPNRPENNISGGSHKAMNAFKVFANAYETLSDRVNAVKMKENIGPSILACILGGNYSSYIIQRQTMKSLKKKDFKDIDERTDIATASGDEWAQELRWMNKMQTTSTRTVLFR